jgi:5'-deoxynucleotidase YfbR-like HD superfamily hydrolase
MSRQDNGETPRAWQRMLSGRRLDLIDPSPLDIEIEDIAHGLARVARWNGQTTGPHAFSVAQHCLLVEHIYRRRLKSATRTGCLAALLHDAPEYVIGDMISPFKAVIGGDYKALENRLLAATHIRFGLPAELSGRDTGRIKKADRIAAYFEAIGLAGFDADEARRFFGNPAGIGRGDIAGLIEPWPANRAQKAYMQRFTTLMAAD